MMDMHINIWIFNYNLLILYLLHGQKRKLLANPETILHHCFLIRFCGSEVIVRYLYTFLFYLALPFIFIRLGLRSLRQPEYRKRVGERLGFYPDRLDRCIWVHAVSVGETLAAIPLIKALKTRYPGLPILITTMTPTGAARVQAAFGDTVKHAYIPYDLPGAMKRLLNSMNPVICIIMETELWPNLLAVTHSKNIPICLVNARLSEKSARGYQRIASLTHTMLQQIDMIAAHGTADAKRFISLGASSEKVMISGNIKFDIELPAELTTKSAELREVLGRDRFIWIAASTHEGEEEIILEAHKQLRAKYPSALLILVPRHPNRFNAIAALSAASFITARRSLNEACTQETQVYLGDTMGELLLLYGASDVAFVAGSLIQRGGHNMLEPAALGKPIIMGKSVYNFAEISELLINAKAMKQVIDADSLTRQLLQWIEQPNEREKAGAYALQVVADNRGALAKQMNVLAARIK